MWYRKSVEFGIPEVTGGCPRIGPFIVRTPYPREHKFKNTKIQKFKKGSKETQNYKLTFYSFNYFATFPFFEKLPRDFKQKRFDKI